MEIKITKELKSHISKMMAVGEEAEKIKKEYPECWNILSKQYQLGFYTSDFIKDDIEILEVKLFANIISTNNIKEKKLEQKVANQINLGKK